MTPFLDDGDVRLYHGDALTVLQGLEDASVHMCVTSPPFYGLRDYGTGRWEGGNPDCDHIPERRKYSDGCVGCGVPMNQYTEGCRNCKSRWNMRERREIPLDQSYDLPPPSKEWREAGSWMNCTKSVDVVCGKCGARRVDQQIGLEETPEQWVDNLVAVFREVRRVLRDDGVLFCEVGDSYASSAANGGQHDFSTSGLKRDGRSEESRRRTLEQVAKERDRPQPQVRRSMEGYKPKDLIGAPWLLAFALRADGWYLRSDIVWARPNPMPESVTDRPTKSHSYVFLLAKRPRYYWDAEAVREASIARPGWGGPQRDTRETHGVGGGNTGLNAARAKATDDGGFNGRNVRSVWNISTQPYPEAHFATFPEELARRCILAGTSERGCCPECGAPWVRVTDSSLVISTTGASGVESPKTFANNDTKQRMEEGLHGYAQRMRRTTKTLGWKPSCDCLQPFEGYADEAGLPPCVVLDPFVGSGTVPYVARKHGRCAIGIDLNAQYLELAAKRLQQQSLFAEAGRSRTGKTWGGREKP